jgi:serine/threonine-protein kinase
MLAQVQAAFPELAKLALIPVTGGQKTVYSATLKNTLVVLKIVHPSSSGDERAAREVVAIEKLKAVAPLLRSPNVPQIYDSGKRGIGGDERYYIIEQYVDGTNLRQVLTATPTLPIRDLLLLARCLLGACGDFSSVKMVHRDINPRNIMRDTNGSFWVIDLGLVRHLDMLSITADGPYRGVLGTPGYAPIEVLNNEKGEVNCRADLFSSGVVLYEAASGRNPYAHGARDFFEVFRRIENDDLPTLAIPGDTGNQFADLIASLAQRYPSRRPQTSQEAADWLAPILALHGI